MFRMILVIAAVAALAVSAGAYPTQWQGEPDGDLTINLALGCYIQIEWQDYDMVFDHLDAGEDYWSETFTGVGYANCPDDEGKFPSEAWAGDHYYAATGLYYMSRDGARIFVRSNNPLSMTVTTNGDLKAIDPTCGDCYIPTWFTLCAAPFMIEGVWLDNGNIPETSEVGSYIHDAGGGAFGYNDGAQQWPNEHAFPCAGAQSWTLGPLCPGIQGTLQWLARIHRNGMLDQGGDYTTWLDVTFTSP